MQYRDRRFPTIYPVSLRSGATSSPCTVSNISARGACILDAPDLNVGDRVEVDFNSGSTSASVMWAVPGKIGVGFQEELAPPAFDLIRHGVPQIAAQ